MNKQQKQVVSDLKDDINSLINDYIPDLIATVSVNSTKRSARKPSLPTASLSNDKVAITLKHKNAIIKHAKNGKNVDFVLNKYPMYTKMQLSAIFAHVTMGTY